MIRSALASFAVLAALSVSGFAGTSYVFVNNTSRSANSVSPYKLDTANGTLTFYGEVGTTGKSLGSGIVAVGQAITSDAHCLFAIDTQSNDIAAFASPSYKLVGKFSNGAVRFNSRSLGGTTSAPLAKRAFGSARFQSTEWQPFRRSERFVSGTPSAVPLRATEMGAALAAAQSNIRDTISDIQCFMRYLVRARVKPGRESDLLKAIENETLGQGSVAEGEYLRNMSDARLCDDQTARWVEVCYCPTPLQEERPYWEQYFDLTRVQDAHDRRKCRDQNGTGPWACSDCDCTVKLEKKLQESGKPFLRWLQGRFV